MTAETDRWPALSALCRAVGVENTFVDGLGQRCEVSADTRLHILQALGYHVRSERDASALLAREVAQAREPYVLVAELPEPGAPEMHVRCTASIATALAEASTVHAEDGDAVTLACRGSEPTANGAARLIFDALPEGVYTLSLSGTPASLLVTRGTCYLPPAGRPPSSGAGVFAPTYALFDRGRPDAGGYALLGRLMEAIGEAGGTMLSTLPLLATFLDEPFEPSPYAPASRLALNELFVDVRATKEFARCPEAQALVDAPEYQAEMRRLAQAPVLDYRAAWTALAPVLDALALVWDQDEAAQAGTALPETALPETVQAYARFRGQTDRGTLRHAYGQYAASTQLAALKRRGDALGVELYLDFPVGVHALSFDVHQYREQFVTGVSVGAPPDALFRSGQSWGLAPLHPERSRMGGHGYLRACLRHHMKYAHVLRIDHVMGLHRQYWVPHGASAKDGTYVTMPHRELYAALAVESQRGRCRVIGENLGTVPEAVAAELPKRRVFGMYISPFSIRHDAPSPRETLVEPRAEELAALNTHDMPSFAGFVRGDDIDDAERLGVYDRDGAEEAHAERHRACEAWRRSLASRGWMTSEASLEAWMRAAYAMLMGSSAEDVLINAEDLWLSYQQQNVPGTHRERPNFRRRLERDIGELTTALAEALPSLVALRPGQRGGPDKDLGLGRSRE